MKTFILAAALTLAGLSGPVSAQDKPVWADPNSKATFGSATTDADQADREAVANLVAQGSDITKPTDVIYYFVMPTKATARRVEPQVVSQGFTVRVEKSPEYGVWFVIANKTLVPSESAILDWSHMFEAIAEKEGGQLDGWEAALVKP